MTKLNLETQTFQELYKRYKNYLIPILILIVSFILLIQITIPQISDLSQKQQEQAAERAKFDTLSKNYNILSSLADSSLNSNLQSATDALPSEKNFASIVNALSLAANKSGIFLGDYELAVGDLSKVPPGSNASKLELVLSVNGGAVPTANFINELYKSLPISEVTSIVVGGNHSTVSVGFYYKPFSNISDPSIPLTELSKEQIDLIRELRGFNDARNLEQIQISTSSATSSSPF